jgi:hypothetical protein
MDTKVYLPICTFTDDLCEPDHTEHCINCGQDVRYRIEFDPRDFGDREGF